MIYLHNIINMKIKNRKITPSNIKLFCTRYPMAKLAKVPAVGPVPPGRREMVSIVVACLDSRLAADEKSAESVPAGCELGTEATDERHAGSAIRRRESVAGATRPAVGAHAS